MQQRKYTSSLPLSTAVVEDPASSGADLDANQVNLLIKNEIPCLTENPDSEPVQLLVENPDRLSLLKSPLLRDTMAAARAECDGLIIGNDVDAEEIEQALEEDEIALEQVMIEDEE